MGLPQRKPILNVAEYLRIERSATYRSEFFRGEVFDRVDFTADNDEESTTTGQPPHNADTMISPKQESR